jgi:hypothetical protein
MQSWCIFTREGILCPTSDFAALLGIRFVPFVIFVVPEKKAEAEREVRSVIINCPARSSSELLRSLTADDADFADS